MAVASAKNISQMSNHYTDIARGETFPPVLVSLKKFKISQL